MNRKLKLPHYTEVNIFIYIAFLVFVVAKYMQWGARREIFKVVRIEFTLGITLSLICIAILIMNSPNLNRGRNIFFGITMLFVIMVLQLPFSAAPAISQDIFIERVIKFAFLTFFMAVLITSPRYTKFFMIAFLFSCFYVTQESVQGLISGGLVWQNQGVMRLHGAVPIYAHPNSLGGIAMGTIPFVIFLFPVVEKWYFKIALLGLLTTSTVCVIYSASRTAYVAFVAFIVFWFVVSKNKKKFMMVIAIAAVVLPMVIPDQYMERFESITGQEAEGESKSARIQILHDAWTIFLSNPGGVGIGAFPIVRQQRYGRHQDTHNLYLEVATNLGVQGFIVFMALIYLILKGLWDSYQCLMTNLEAISRALKNRKLAAASKTMVRDHIADIEFLRGVIIATTGFIYVRLCLGFFGMDLYEVYWWFASGVSISMLNMGVNVTNNTKRILYRIQLELDIRDEKSLEQQLVNL